MAEKTLEEQVAAAKQALRLEKRDAAVAYFELAQTRLVEWLSFETDPGLKDRIHLGLKGVEDALNWVKP